MKNARRNKVSQIFQSKWMIVMKSIDFVEILTSEMMDFHSLATNNSDLPRTMKNAKTNNVVLLFELDN